MSDSRPRLVKVDKPDEIDLSQFEPVKESAIPAVPPEAIRQLAEANGFPSRAVRVDQLSAVNQPNIVGRPPTIRQPMVYRTGRNTVFSAKTTPETVDIFYKIAQSQGWKAGETFEKAVQALVEKLHAKEAQGA